jgi:glycosyltransferase involved in cell wall biosynthesis
MRRENSHPPKVSIIIPTYNRYELLLETIQSVLAQTYQDYEMLIIDDGSSDGTYDRIQTLFGEYAKVKIVEQANQGRSAARNKGLSIARGEYIVFCDDDDWFLPEYLEKHVSNLDTHLNYGIIFSDMNFCDSHGKLICRGSEYHGVRPPSGEIFEAMLIKCLVYAPACAMVRKQCLDEIGDFDESLEGIEDWDLWLRLAARYKFFFLDEPLSNYRIHSQMSTYQQVDLISKLKKIRAKICEMPEFKVASRETKSRFYVIYGTMKIMIGEISPGRNLLVEGLKSNPVQVRAYFLYLCSVFGVRIFREIIFVKRWLVRKLYQRPEKIIPEYV